MNLTTQITTRDGKVLLKEIPYIDFGEGLRGITGGVNYYVDDEPVLFWEYEDGQLKIIPYPENN